MPKRQTGEVVPERFAARGFHINFLFRPVSNYRVIVSRAAMSAVRPLFARRGSDMIDLL